MNASTVIVHQCTVAQSSATSHQNQSLISNILRSVGERRGLTADDDHGLELWIDVGDQDGLRIDARKLHEILDAYGVANSFEVYQGTHTSRVADRFQNDVMKFFSKNLCFRTNCR